MRSKTRSTRGFYFAARNYGRVNAPNPKEDVGFELSASSVRCGHRTTTSTFARHITVSLPYFLASRNKIMYINNTRKPLKPGLYLVWNRRRKVDLGLKVYGLLNSLQWCVHLWSETIEVSAKGSHYMNAITMIADVRALYEPESSNDILASKYHLTILGEEHTFTHFEDMHKMDTSPYQVSLTKYGPRVWHMNETNQSCIELHSRYECGARVFCAWTQFKVLPKERISHWPDALCF